MKNPFGRSANYPAQARLARGIEGGTAAYEYELAGGLYACAFWGKSLKPIWHYRFKTAEDRAARIADLFTNFEAHEKRKEECRAARKAEQCATPADVYKRALSEIAKGSERAYVRTKDIAVLIRGGLERRFPGVKFSVRSSLYSGGSSIDVDCPPSVDSRAVRQFCSRYNGSGFDGMIDLKYSKTLWLAPNGEVSFAHTQGSQGSAGVDPEQCGSPHHPQAVQIWGGADWVHVHQREPAPPRIVIDTPALRE